MNNKHKALRIILLILIILTLIVIWGHSCMPRAQSTEESSFVKELLDSMVQTVSGNQSFAIPEVVIRKSAHLLEYAFLGLELAVFFLLNNKGKIRFALPFISALVVASIDETIQYFSGRYSSIFDVALDMVGASIAIGLIFLIRKIFKRKKSIS
jgi:VanZ family protein